MWTPKAPLKLNLRCWPWKVLPSLQPCLLHVFSCVMAVAAALMMTKAQCHGVECFLEFHGILIMWAPPLMLSLRMMLGLESPPLLTAMLVSCIWRVGWLLLQL